MELNDRELATVLAGLRMVQRHGIDAEINRTIMAGMWSLSNEDIDDLCERLNTEETD